MIFAAFAAALSSYADVVRTDVPPAIDGRLDDACWAAAEWNGPFVRLANSVKDRTVGAQTSFAVLADSKTLYVAVKCDEPDMAALKAMQPSALYICDQIELFLSPRGDGFDFYQFAIAFDPRNGSAARYASEGGTITPDPYGPEWKFARGESDGGWCVEIAIPFSSLYMTRNEQWRDEWRVNVVRDRKAGGKTEWTTWSPLKTKFLEPNSFNRMKGFPKRLAADDVGITDAVADISGRRDGALAGTLSFAAYVAEGGEYEASSQFSPTTTLRLKAGANAVRMPCAYPANGRHQTRIELKRKATGEAYARTYPVVVDFEEIRLGLTQPEYRNNFYPGQDASRVKGRVMAAVSGEVLATLEGPGFPRREIRLPQGGGEIDFDTTGGAKREFKIRKLAKTGRRMAWISKGRLVVDGKPVLRRGIYAQGYMGGKAFAEKFAADKRLYLTPEVSQGGSLEPFRVIKTLETREARKDVVPCKEYFDKIDAMIEKSKDRNFVYWYISDEPECRGLSPVYLRHIYEHVKEKDPYHVILTASRGGRKYIDCADWFETHPYLNPHDDGRGNRVLDYPLNRIGAYLDAFGAWDRPDKCIGFLPTMFAYRMKSILNDAYHDMGDRASLYEGNRYVNSTFAALEEFILDGKRTTLLKTPEAECARWDLESGESMFALANFTAERRDIPLPKGLSDRKWRPFRGQRAKGGVLEPYEVVVGTTDVRDEGLETYAEAKAVVDKQEHERTHRDNQMLEKYLELGFAASNGRSGFYKLVDGTRDVIGWYARDKNPWVEFSFAGKPARFSRLRVYGSGLANMKVSIRKGGEWKELTSKAVESGKYVRELDFGAVYSTVKMRISFPSGKGVSDVELYEVELPATKDEEGAAKAASSVSAGNAREASADVLWKFDAKNAKWAGAQYSGGMWYGGDAKPGVSPRDDGGFTVHGRVVHAVRLDPAYPWVELELDAFREKNTRAYHAWWLRLHKIGVALAGTVTNPQSGLYVVRMPTIDKTQGDYVKFDNHNFDIGVKRLRCVKSPADFIVAEAAGGASAIAPGGVFEVALELAAPCEDVTTTLLIDHGHGSGFVGFPINGTNAIELKMADASGRKWKASVPVKTCGKAGARRVYVKCIVLGGALKTPLFTTVNQPFHR